MDFGQRCVMWIGPTVALIRLQAGPGAPRVLSFATCPVVPVLSSGGEWEELTPWLATVARPGDLVDVLYQDHLLSVESFPGLGAVDLAGALRARLSRDHLISPEELLDHPARFDRAGQTQFVYAAVLNATHLGVERAIAAAGLVLGRVGFAGQLALKLFASHAPGGGWTVFPDMACEKLLLLAIEPTGSMMTSAFADPSEVTAESVSDRIRGFLPQVPAGTQPIDLRGLRIPGTRALGGLALPEPLASLLPVFLCSKEWRIASQEDLEYPYFLGPSAWAFTVAMALLLVWTAGLLFQVWEIRSVQADVFRLQREKREVTQALREKNSKLDSLLYIEKNVRGLGAETFDNASWLSLLGQLRDKSAAGLYFDSISVKAATITLLGSFGDSTPVLTYVTQLTTALGESAVSLQSLTRDEAGRFKFSIEVRRETSVPPAPPEEAG